MLNTYLAQTKRLLQTPSAPISLYADGDLDVYINEARVQVAGESQSIPQMGTLAITTGNPGPYPFTSIVYPTASTVTGIGATLNMRTAWYVVGAGQKWMRPRPWPWFCLFELNSPVPQTAPPRAWTQYGQGENGSIYVNTPDIGYTLKVDTICVPIALADDTTVEAVPPLWQTAVPYYAAYLALLSAQTSARMEEAMKMFELYTEFTKRARTFATSEVMPTIYQQVQSPVRQNQLGMQGQQAGGPPR